VTSPATDQDSAARTRYPLTIDNCGFQLTFDGPPSRAVTLNQTVTEILLALGLGDRMVGTAFLQNAVLPEHRATYDAIPVLADRYPSREELVAADPDFVYAGLAGSLGEDPVAGRQQLSDLGITVFQSTEYCAANPGATTAPLTMDVLYSDIRTIAMIFDVSDRGEALIGRLRSQVADVQRAVANVETRARVARLALLEPASATTDGQAGVGDLVIELAGGENVFGDLPGRQTSVSWEEVVNRDPEVIFFTLIGRGPERDTEFLNTLPAIANTDAVVNQRYFSIGADDVLLGVRTPRAIRALAEYLYPDAFTN
jgi:iron complex transport system substrate-binding protein